ncbi:MAG: hypothetical protein V4772_18975 [Pseudomonadota bacterium]
MFESLQKVKNKIKTGPKMQKGVRPMQPRLRWVQGTNAFVLWARHASPLKLSDASHRWLINVTHAKAVPAGFVL